MKKPEIKPSNKVIVISLIGQSAKILKQAFGQIELLAQKAAEQAASRQTQTEPALWQKIKNLIRETFSEKQAPVKTAATTEQIQIEQAEQPPVGKTEPIGAEVPALPPEKKRPPPPFESPTLPLLPPPSTLAKETTILQPIGEAKNGDEPKKPGSENAETEEIIAEPTEQELRQIEEGWTTDKPANFSLLNFSRPRSNEEGGTGKKIKGEGKTDVDILKTYLKSIGRIPLITKEREAELGKLIQNGLRSKKALDQAAPLAEKDKIKLSEDAREGELAKHKLVEANLRLVVNIAKNYANYGLPLIDLVQEGNIGLMRAAVKYDYGLGFKFSTYATW